MKFENFFDKCETLTSIDISTWDTSNIKTISQINDEYEEQQKLIAERKLILDKRKVKMKRLEKNIKKTKRLKFFGL